MTTRKKINSYLGFATKSRNLVSGYNTCIFEINRRKAKLLIIAEDVSDNSQKKLSEEAERMGVDYRIYGTIEELSAITGNQGRGLYVIKDSNFAKVILNEIDQEREVF